MGCLWGVECWPSEFAEQAELKEVVRRIPRCFDFLRGAGWPYMIIVDDGWIFILRSVLVFVKLGHLYP